MQDTLYWSRKSANFASKCKDQSPSSGGILRKYTNPQTGEPGEVWEYQKEGFSGLITYCEIRDGKFGQEFMLSLFDGERENVLQFKVTDIHGRLTQDIKGFAKKCANIDVTVDLMVSIWQDFKNSKQLHGKTVVPSYVVLNQGAGPRPASVKSSFPFVEGKGYEGIPEIVKKTGIGGKTTYDSTDQDVFLYDHLKKWVDSIQEQVKFNRSQRPQTPAESAVHAGVNAAGIVNEDIEEDVNF